MCQWAPITSRRLLGPTEGSERETSIMGCTRPLVRLNTGQIISLKVYLQRNGKYYQREASKLSENQHEKALLKMLKNEDAQLLPCGHCTGCKMQNASSWANRMEMELPYHENAWFLTLTYDNEHVPWSYNQGLGVNKKTGEIEIENLTLNYEDMQKFWKRLRRYIEYHKMGIGKLMYFQAGEYGGKTHRPHYHAIVYDLPIEQKDLKVYKKRNGSVYYNVEWLSKLWGMGHVVIAQAEWKAMAYTARYTTKKIYGHDAKRYYEELGVLPERCMMSKNPAIGEKYYQDHKEEIYTKDEIQLKNGKRCKPPRYFDKLFDLEHSNAKPLTDKESELIEDTIVKAESEELKAIKRERRRIANDALFAQLKQTGLTMQEYYEAKDKKNQEKFAKLIRSEI